MYKSDMDDKEWMGIGQSKKQNITPYRYPLDDL